MSNDRFDDNGLRYNSRREISLHITCSNILLEGIKKGSHVKQKNRSMSTRPTGGQIQ